jgi:hypothetical protein
METINGKIIHITVEDEQTEFILDTEQGEIECFVDNEMPMDFLGKSVEFEALYDSDLEAHIVKSKISVDMD